MPRQMWLPGFPEGAKKIGGNVYVLERDELVTYFVDCDNYFSHRKDDHQSRRFVLACLMDNGHVKACELEASPLCIPHRTLMNWTRQLRDGGSAAFFRQAVLRKPRVMTADKNAECAQLIAEGLRPSQAARKANVKETTLRKAIDRKALPVLPQIINDSTDTGSSKSERSQADAQACSGMGMACTRADERIEAAMGLVTSAQARFEAGHDIPMVGLLTGLPALCTNGLLSGLENHFKLPKGFYSAMHILLTLGFMALGRIRRPEGLRHIPPGEFGKVIGLDRVPEVKTLREKVKHLAATGDPEKWMQELSRNWMHGDPEEAGYLYIDGHIRVYHGNQAKLPRRYVSRERLCLHGTTDYWVNDALGRPFFVVSKAVTEGLANSILKDIVPALLESVPNQPTQEELDANPLLHRFVMVFDREGATYSLLSQLWQQRIGALTYRKNVKDTWPESEFLECEVAQPGGGSTHMKLAVRETQLGSGTESMPVTEVRRLTVSDHQTSVITTARLLGNTVIAGRMFTRWCQENYFAYMMQHYDIDGLIEYGTEMIPGTAEIVNPKWKEADKAVRQARKDGLKLKKKLAEVELSGNDDIQKKAELVEGIGLNGAEIKQLLGNRKEIARKVQIDSLPEAERPTQLKPLGKMLTDAIKMVAYRAETAMVALLRRNLKNEDEARALIRELFVSAGDIEPNETTGTLTIKIHRMTCQSHDVAIAALLESLTQMEFTHPETGAKMVYRLV